MNSHIGDLVLGANRLIVDLTRAILEADAGSPPVAVLVDPQPEHWADAEAFAAPIVVVLEDPTAERIIAAVRRGADGVVAADEVTERLREVVKAVRAGGARLEPQHLRAVVDELRRSEVVDDRPSLSKRESEILVSIAHGHSVKQTANHLGITAKTVENLQSRLFKKLDVRNRAHAVARAFELGLFDDGALGDDATLG